LRVQRFWQLLAIILKLITDILVLVLALVGVVSLQQLAAPRSVTESGSKRLLNSYAVISERLSIVEYNADLSLNITHEISYQNYQWTDVVACDQYYVALSQSTLWEGVRILYLFTMQNGSGYDMEQIAIPINVTRFADNPS
jgi:hypothetical protein